MASALFLKGADGPSPGRAPDEPVTVTAGPTGSAPEPIGADIDQSPDSDQSQAPDRSSADRDRSADERGQGDADHHNGDPVPGHEC